MSIKKMVICILPIMFFFSVIFGNDEQSELSGAALENDNELVENSKYAFVNEIYDESWALLIGINEYQNVPPLNYAVNDAVAVKDMLIESYGFKEENIILIIDEEATKTNIIQGFSDILTNAKERDRVVVFYAGHGDTYKLPSGGDMGYLIPVDGDLDNLYVSSIPMKSVYDIADMSYAKHIMYLVDACYGGLTLNTRGLKKAITPEYLKRMTRERGRQVITAGGKDEEVIEKPEWGHSAFTRNLLKGLGDGLADENSDGVITGDELGGFIKNRVVVDVDGAHTPQKGRIGSDMGEFVFISKMLDEQFIDLSPKDDKLSDLESEMRELKKLLELKDQKRGNSKMDKAAQMRKAAKLSWMFPGAGHFVSGETSKGLLFSGLELAALAGLAMFSSSYSTNSDAYDAELAEYENWANAVQDTGEWSSSQLSSRRKTVNEAFDLQQQNLQSLISCGVLSGAIWLWNVRDMKKMQSSGYADNNGFSMSINRHGQFEARISF
ncbi:MAG: caspase family protein [Candidatus Neomarinimicrobiota bacterium]|nr:caspase family protein [Candidatus Neomarinimicrobiota bacterium]